MTLSRMVKPLIGIIMIPIVGWAIYLNVVTPIGATASRQPALVNHAAYGVDGPTGFDQAQGGGQ